MKFSDFKSVEDVIKKYPMTIRQERFLPNNELKLSDVFIQALNFAIDRRMVGESEMYYREYIISPFMQQAWMRHPALQLWVNRYLTYKDELHGEPDYFLSKLPDTPSHELISKPFLAVAEAKRDDFIEGWGQCLAAMVACQKLNDDNDITIYGIVCNGDTWQFGKLYSTTFTRHSLSYATSQPELIFGSLDYIFNECEKQI
jgi:hypothetical protein